MLLMTRHKATQPGLGTPSPLDRWINAMLRGLAMLVSHVAHLCSMRLIRPPAECHSDATPEALPCTESGKLKETTPAAGSSNASQSSNAREGLILRTRSATAELVDSKDEAGLTALSTSHPRPCAEDLGSRGGGTRPDPHDLPTETLGSSPRMTRGWIRWENTQARAVN
jgi:hypothetical protein